jgi:hypothetical protein
MSPKRRPSKSAHAAKPVLTGKTTRTVHRPIHLSTVAGLRLNALVKQFRTCREAKATAGRPTESIESANKEALRNALQGVANLELATIPPYLCALWSVKDDRHPVANSIREVVQEEMLHLALVTNLLVGIGGTPQLDRTGIRYPTRLPLGVHPKLVVTLGGLNDDRLLEFLHIERPHNGLIVTGGQHPRNKEVVALATGKPVGPTIGDLYDEVKASFHRLPEDEQNLSTNRQITGPLARSSTWSLKGVDHSIDLIKRQGEGAQGVFDLPGDLSHFYRFWEIFEGRTIDATNPLSPKFSAPIQIDRTNDIYPMGAVPKGGYVKAKVSDEVWCHLVQFDALYSELLDSLQDVWTRDGGQASFWHAIPSMFGLEKHARALMQIPIPGGKGKTYGPCFRYIKRKERE